MKQRVSAIILLLSFIGVMAHDMLPHHHHDDYNISETHIDNDKHDHDKCNHSSNDSNELTIKASHENHCPHELHNCTTSYYNVSRVSNQQAQHISKDCLTPTLSALSSTSDYEIQRKIYFDSRSHIYCNIYLSISQLRGPPSLS